MGAIRSVLKVLPVAAVAYNDAEVAAQAVRLFAARCGGLLDRSESYNFSRFTDYYCSDMGRELEKYFCAFDKLIDPDQLVDLKLEAMRIEDLFRTGKGRCVNLDPGYLEYSKLVLATTKNYDHRIYLRDGIYGDVQLRYRRGRFCFNDWTYPDYKSDLAIGFFTRVRGHYIRLEKESRRVLRPNEVLD